MFCSFVLMSKYLGEGRYIRAMRCMFEKRNEVKRVRERKPIFTSLRCGDLKFDNFDVIFECHQPITHSGLRIIDD